MTENPSTFTQSLDVAERLSAEELVVDLEGFEGPLDLLLTHLRSGIGEVEGVGAQMQFLDEQVLSFRRHHIAEQEERLVRIVQHLHRRDR